MLHKNLPPVEFLYKFPLRLIMDGMAGVKFLIDGDYKDCVAVIRAHFRFYALFPSRIKLKRKERRLQKIKRVKGVYHHSIVADYYLRGIRKFSQMKPGNF